MASLPHEHVTARDARAVPPKRIRGSQNVDAPWTEAFRRAVAHLPDGSKKLLALRIGAKAQSVVSRLLSGNGASAERVLAAARMVEIPPPGYLFEPYQHRLLAALERLRRAARLRYQRTPNETRARFQELVGDEGVARADQRVDAIVSDLEDRIERAIVLLDSERAEHGGDGGARPLGAARR